jgi:hypothetical protein
VPRTIELHRLPPKAVEIVPAYREHLCFIVADGTIVIVDPAATRRLISSRSDVKFGTSTPCEHYNIINPERRFLMKKTLAIALAATFTTATLAYADSVTIRQTDPEPTNSIVIKEKQDPDLIIKKKKKVVIEEDNDPDVTIKGSINVD